MEERKRTAEFPRRLHRLYSAAVLSALICCLSLPAYSQAKDVRIALQTVFRGELGKDDRESIRKYLRYTDLEYGHEWCAAFVSWCFGQVDYPEPRTPWSPSLFPNKRTVWKQGQALPKGPLEAGKVWGIHILSKGRIGHVGFIDSEHKGILTTVEGNTQPPEGKGTHGVYKKRRALRTLKAIAEWL